MQLPNIPKHPLDDHFRRLKIPRTQLSAYLARPHSTVCAWLNGYNPMPSEVKAKLEGLIRELKNSEDHSLEVGDEPQRP